MKKEPLYIPSLCLVREIAIRKTLKHAKLSIRKMFKLASKEEIKQWEMECGLIGYVKRTLK